MSLVGADVGGRDRLDECNDDEFIDGAANAERTDSAGRGVKRGARWWLVARLLGRPTLFCKRTTPRRGED